MVVSARNRWLWSLSTIAVVAALGMFESLRSDQIGLFGLMCFIEVMTVGLAWSLRRQAPVAVRSDLVAWLETTSAITGESAGAVADRALSAYRAAMRRDRG
jgi:hypothetical protein